MRDPVEDDCADPRLRPLQKPGRWREADAEQQIERLLHCSAAEVMRLARISDHRAPGYVKPEALVYLLRHWKRCGNSQLAGDIAGILLERTARYVARKLPAWDSLSTSQVDDCVSDVCAAMWPALFDMTEKHEFWEVRFFVPVLRLLLNFAGRYAAVAKHEHQPEPITDGRGGEIDPMDQVPDGRWSSPENRLFIRQALARLTDDERTVFVLYHQENWSQQEIASELGVTDRTVRNRLTRAQHRLQEWLAGIPADR